MCSSAVLIEAHMFVCKFVELCLHPHPYSKAKSKTAIMVARAKKLQKRSYSSFDILCVKWDAWGGDGVLMLYCALVSSSLQAAIHWLPGVAKVSGV